MLHRPVEILLVEDSPADARLTLDALLQGSVPKRVSVVTDGVQAIDFVRRRGDFSAAPRPDLILLDLNLPKRSGLEVLREIKTDPSLRSITVIVLTTSQFPDDVNAAYELCANCYIVKPVDLEHFFQVMRGIEEFWMSLAALPSRDQGPSRNPNGESGENEPPKTGSVTAEGVDLSICRIQFAAVSVLSSQMRGSFRRWCSRPHPRRMSEHPYRRLTTALKEAIDQRGTVDRR